MITLPNKMIVEDNLTVLDNYRWVIAFTGIYVGIGVGDFWDVFEDWEKVFSTEE